METITLAGDWSAKTAHLKLRKNSFAENLSVLSIPVYPPLSCGVLLRQWHMKNIMNSQELCRDVEETQEW